MSDVQMWERRVPGSDVAIVRTAIEIDDCGVAQVDEALLAQLLTEAGWERQA